MQHYHTDLDIQEMPEYVLRHNSKDHGLYTLCYQYFVQRWERTEIPEYDLDTDELVYRDRNGCEVKKGTILAGRCPAERAAGERGPRVNVNVTHDDGAAIP